MTLGKKSQRCIICNRRGDEIKSANCQWVSKEANSIICKKHKRKALDLASLNSDVDLNNNFYNMNNPEPLNDSIHEREIITESDLSGYDSPALGIYDYEENLEKTESELDDESFFIDEKEEKNRIINSTPVIFKKILLHL